MSPLAGSFATLGSRAPAMRDATPEHENQERLAPARLLRRQERKRVEWLLLVV
jgi:hypothetical protein